MDCKLCREYTGCHEVSVIGRMEDPSCWKPCDDEAWTSPANCGGSEQKPDGALPFEGSGNSHDRQPHRKRTKTVLVIEDEPSILFALRETVLRKSYCCIAARDGEEGLAKAREIIPDLIITDVVMPKLDGYTLCSILKEDPATRHIPIVIVTARTQQSDRLAGIEAGADAFICKPFKLEDLSNEIDRCIPS